MGLSRLELGVIVGPILVMIVVGLGLELFWWWDHWQHRRAELLRERQREELRAVVHRECAFNAARRRIRDYDEEFVAEARRLASSAATDARRHQAASLMHTRLRLRAVQVFEATDGVD